jgi:membrane-bound lytic murein transglycosylase F
MIGRRIIVFIACLVAGCEEAPKPIAPVSESGELVVLTVNGPSTYFEDAQGLPSGFEYDLATLFAKELKAKPTFILIDNPARIDHVLRQGQAHLAAAALARHFDFPGGLAWGPSYLNTQHQIVCRAGEPKAKRIEDLADKRIGVIEESVADYLLADPPHTTVPIERLAPGTSTADLLERVASEKLDCALVESTRYTLARRFFPQLEVAFNMGKPVDYAWLIPTVDKKRIADAAVPFFERIRKDGTLKRLIDRYYGHATRFSAIDAGALLDQIGAMLPLLKAYFQEAERQSGIDWRLIAAIGYQESHWDAKATSPTGVRGLMMLTEETAEPDRTYLALAAYNIGIGHLEDARILAQKANLNPDKWQDVRQVIGKLAEPDSFQSVKHGYARGGEAMQLVDNIRNYYDILTRMEPRDAPMLPALAEAQDSSKGSGAGK